MDSAKSDAPLREAVAAAVGWLTGTAANRTETPVGKRGAKLRLKSWVGAIRGEYRAATKEWDSFCPVWHTGQAVKALVAASEALGRPEWLERAVFHAEFLLANQIADGPDAGMLLGFEDHPGKDYVNTSAVLESLDGLFELSRATGDERFADAAVRALRWVKRTAWLPERGLFDDLYDIHQRCFVHGIQAAQGRPLLDDAVFLTGWQLTGDAGFREVALRTAETLVRDEFPAGNWLNYGPCSRDGGVLHPRHAYWWGNPMLEVYEATGEERFRELFLRSACWYLRALRLDGGLFRDTSPAFNTTSFGHAASGSASAAVMLLRAWRASGEREFLEGARRALRFCLSMQFTRAGDPALNGAILEKVLPPDGSDASPYHVRDLGTIFFLQAAALWLRLSPPFKL